VALLQGIFIPERLFLQEAKALDLDQDPELLDFLSRKREELLISLLRQREVDQHTTASDEEAQAFFDSHPEKFTSPETIVVTEILVPSDSLAYRLKRELQEGADATPLAVQHTMREGALHHSGNLRLNVYTQAFYPIIYEAAQHLEVGEVGGPVPTGEGYSVFRVIDRGREKEPYDADTQRRARAYVKIDKAKRGYVHYVRSLRQKYSVTLFEENVAEMQRSAEE
jgi:parvulin-like peptidyl-prolyl isomerase